MLTAVLFLALTLVVFIAATVVAVMVMLAIGAKRGRTTAVDAATLSLISRRTRRLGLNKSAPADDGKPPS